MSSQHMEDAQLGDTNTGHQLHISKTWGGPDSNIHRSFCGRPLYHIFEQLVLVDLDDLDTKRSGLTVKEKPVCSRCLSSFKMDRQLKKIKAAAVPAG